MSLKKENVRITVAGTGYVGLSMATLLSQHHEVQAVDLVKEKGEMINARKSPIQDAEIERFFAEKELKLQATTDGEAAYRNADLVIIATPTNYDAKRNFFDTSAVEAVIDLVLKVNPKAFMVIKSTIPVGYTEHIRKEKNCKRIFFAPEFLRESKALYDNLYPSRIIVGTDPDNPDPCGKEPSRKKSTPSSWALRKRRRSNFLPTPIWRCGSVFLTNWIPMRK